MGVNGSSNRSGVTGDLFFVSAGGASPKHQVHRMSKKRRVSVDDMSDLDVFRIVFVSFCRFAAVWTPLAFSVCVRVIAI